MTAVLDTVGIELATGGAGGAAVAGALVAEAVARPSGAIALDGGAARVRLRPKF